MKFYMQGPSAGLHLIFVQGKVRWPVLAPRKVWPKEIGPLVYSILDTINIS